MLRPPVSYIAYAVQQRNAGATPISVERYQHVAYQAMLRSFNQHVRDMQQQSNITKVARKLQQLRTQE